MNKPISQKTRKMQTEAKPSKQLYKMKKLQEFLQANDMSDLCVALFDKKTKKVKQIFTDLSRENQNIIGQHLSKNAKLTQANNEGSNSQFVSSSDESINDINESTLESGKKMSSEGTDQQMS